jgi:hypothetical protein
MGYEELLLISQNMQYFLGSLIVSNYSNLTAEKAIQARLGKVQTRKPVVMELGYNLQLQKRRIMLKFTTTKRLADSRKKPK